ncbi:MAG: S9 family peptidase [Gemmatimonadetes bacterium]|nr:S9 family peptidase [Gemmatimonadota bacterium]
MMAYTSSDITHLTELFVAQSNGGGEKRLTSFNDKYLTEVTTIPADTFWYESVGGLKIQGWLHQPYGYEAGKKYPLVLYIHGGPHGQYGHVYFHEFQMLAGQGYWTLFTNPRGSTGYGHDFTYATRRRWGMEDYQDLMNAVDEVIRRTAQVDTTRMAVLGGSYGGFMTNWIIGHTNRFAVAQTDRSISNWFSWYGSSEAQGLTEYEFGGFPWEQDSLYRALSPFTYVTNMKTPNAAPDRAQRGGLPRAHHGRGAAVHGPEETRRAGGVRAVSPKLARALAHRAAVAAGGPAGADPDLVCPLDRHGRHPAQGGAIDSPLPKNDSPRSTQRPQRGCCCVRPTLTHLCGLCGEYRERGLT